MRKRLQAPRALPPRKLAAFLVPAAAASAAFVAAVMAAFEPASSSAARAPRGITPAVRTLAARWAQTRGLPLEWVLATIIVESGGNPRLEGDCFKDGERLPECKSLGLMQVNWFAHGARLTRLGIARAREDLFDPAINIEAGTLLLREAYDTVRAAAGDRPLPLPLDVLVRFAYKGPALVANALRAGQNPAARFSDAERTLARWAAAKATVEATAAYA